MKIKKVKIRNFKSIAGKWVEFEINDGLTFITGEKNGCGKTSLINAIVFGIFGKNSDLKGSSKTSIPVKEMINETNGKELEVHIILDNGIEIQRGLKPDYFKILKDGVNLADKSSKTIDQKYLENEILGGLSFDTFNKVNFISAKAVSIPFLYMSLSDRKSFIENILDIRIMYYIQQVIKQRISKTKLDLKTIESEMQMLKNFVESEIESIAHQKIKRIEQMQKLQEIQENKEALIEKAQIEISDAEIEIYDLKLEASGLHDKNKNLEKELITLKNEISDIDKIKEEIDKIDKTILSLKNDVIRRNNEKQVHENNLKGFEICGSCPTVEKIVGTFDYDKFKEFVQVSKQKVIDLQNKKTKLLSEFDERNETKTKISEIETTIKDNLSKIEMKRQQVKSLNQQIEKQKSLQESLRTQITDMQIPEVDEFNLNEYKDKLHKTEEKYDNQKNIIDKHEYLKSVLGNKNIKQELFEYYIPLFEKRTNEVLDVLMEDDSFAFRIELVKDFNIIGYRNGKKSNIFKLSEGQKASINFAFLFAILYVLQLKNGFQLDFLFIDEVLDGALSLSRKDKVLKLLKEMSINIPVILVSHDQSLNKEYFDNEVYVYMKNKISTYDFK